MRKCFFVGLLILLCTHAVQAQNHVTGKVITTNNLPLAGATVLVRGTTAGITTAEDGSFTINADAGDILEISYVGYKTRSLTLDAGTFITITLTESAINLDEVVVTGYSTQRIKEITGSVAVVRANDLTAIPVGQVEQMLQGRVAGLQVITSGMPGSGSNVRLHGIGNFGDVTPLYIIDGVEGNINQLNPYDIESIQVLKDAGAYSIYGVRGANGVLVVTTKKGKSGKTKISYDAYTGITHPPKKGLDLLSPQENADLIWMALRNAGQTGSNGNPSHVLYGNGPTPVLPEYLFAGPYRGIFATTALTDPALYNMDTSIGPIYQIVRFNKEGTDWFGEQFKPAWSQSHTVTLSGGGNRNQYLFSIGYLDQQGTVLNTYLKRYTARINTEFGLNKAIRVGENLQLAYSRNPQGWPNYLMHSYLPVNDIMGNWSSYGGPGSGYGDNPVAYLNLSKDNRDNNWAVFGNAYAEVDLFRRLTFRTSFGGSLNFFYGYNFDHGSFAGPPHGRNNTFNESSGYFRSYLWTNTLTYNEAFRKHHRLKVLVETEERNNYNRNQSGSRSGYFTADPSYRFLSTGQPVQQTNGSTAGTSYLYSFFSQANYSYKEKYLFSGTVRRDGSSVFGPQNRFGWFPAVSVAWRATEEAFMDNLHWLTDLKLRGSWGKTGFDRNTHPNNQYTTFGGGSGSAYYDINGTSNSLQQGLRRTRFGNAQTGWQEDIVTNIGFEAVLWDGKLNITADRYIKKSKGLLFPLSLPAVLGSSARPNVNVGNVKNTGFDLLIGSKGRIAKDWNWDVAATFTTYRNRILKLNDIPYFYSSQTRYGDNVRNEVGHPIGSFYGFKIIGLFQDENDVAKSAIQDAAEPGRFKYLDANGDGSITDADRVHFGNPNPDFTLGFNLGLTYKSFDFTTFFYGSFGNDVLNQLRYTIDIFPSDLFLTPKSKTALYHSWTPQRKNAKTPKAENNQNFSNAATINSYPLEKGSYLRNKTMIIGYSFPRKLLQTVKVERLRFYIQAANLFTITNYSGLDPELPGDTAAWGIDNGTYPNQKQYSFGLNLNF